MLFASDFFFRDDLRGPRLAPDIKLARDAYAARRAAFVDHAPHPVINYAYGLRRQLQLGRLVVIILDLFKLGRFRLFENVRRVIFAARDYARFRVNQLNRRHGDRPLTYGSKHRVKVFPYRVARVHALLPIAARNYTPDLARQVYAGLLP